MANSIFTWLESICSSFPEELPDKPPVGLFPFMWHYSKPFAPLLIASATASTVVALLEVWLFSFVGKLVDWVSASSPETFLDDHGLKMIGLGFLVMVLIPFLKFCYEAIHHQGSQPDVFK